MKKGIITLILTIIGFTNVINVNANTANFTYVDNGMDFYSGAKIYNCYGTNDCRELDDTTVENMTNYQDLIQDSNNAVYQKRLYALSNTNVKNFGSNGIAVSLLLSDITLISNSYYSTTAYVCTTNNQTVNFKEAYVSTMYANFISNQVGYSKQTISNSISKWNFVYTDNNAMNYCRAISFIYKPATDGNVLTIKLTSNENLGTWVFVGTQTELIGDAGNISLNDVNSAISNSGLATADSISQVQNSVNQVQEELNGVNNSIEEQTQQQHEDSQAQIDSQNVCKVIDKSNTIQNGYLWTNGTISGTSSSANRITDYIKISTKSKIKILEQNNVVDFATCFYNVNKVLISCVNTKNISKDSYLNIPENSTFARFSINNNTNAPQFEVCTNGNQAMMDADAEYNTNASEKIQGKEDIDNMTEAEDNLMNNLDFSGASDLNISINPNSSNFIWDIVNRIRNMNVGIITLFTSILGLGIVKMILNR